MTPVRSRVAPGAAATSPPPHAYFVGSAVFHYLGPAFAVLLFVRVEPLGVAWFRIASAAAIFAALAPAVARFSTGSTRATRRTWSGWAPSSRR